MIPDIDPSRANYIFNHPSVYPYVKGTNEGPLDISRLFDGKNIILSWENGVAVFHKIDCGLYELHSAILPEGRGEEGYEWAEKFFSYMFTKTDAVEILTKCPVHNRAAIFAAKKHGFIYEFTTSPQWLYENELHKIEIYCLSIQNWSSRNEDMKLSGELFHKDLHAQYEKMNLNIDVHPEDGEHNKRAGICFSMILGEQINKAIALYNRWAVMSGYEKIKIISYEPLVMDIAESKIMIENGTFKVIPCQ